MALDKNSKLSDIVAILQECEGINQKEELKNILTNIGMSVPDNASMADMIILLNESDFNLSDVVQRLQNIVGGLNEISELSSVLNEKNIETSTNDSLEDLILKVKDIKQPTGDAEPEDVIQGKTFSNKDNIDLIGTATIQSLGGGRKSFGSGVVSNKSASISNLNFTPTSVLVIVSQYISGDSYYIAFTSPIGSWFSISWDTVGSLSNNSPVMRNGNHISTFFGGFNCSIQIASGQTGQDIETDIFDNKNFTYIAFE